MIPPFVRRSFLLALSAGVVLALTAACGGDKPDDGVTGAVAPQLSVSTPETSASPPASLARSAGNSEFSITISRQIRFIWPAGGAITTYFGNGHPNGIDIALDPGSDSPIKASAAGTVVYAGGDPCCSLGLAVEIEHADGARTRYGHFASISVGEGQEVKQGDIIGLGGSTGVASGKHLHFEMYQNGVAVDPLRYLSGDQLSISGTERISCANASIRLDPASELQLRFIPLSLSSVEVRTVAYTGVNAAARSLGIEAERGEGATVAILVPELPQATGDNFDAGLDIVLGNSSSEQLVDCRLSMTTRRTLPNPPGTGEHIFVASGEGELAPTPTPTPTPVLGAQPVLPANARPTQTPVRNSTPVKPQVQKPVTGSDVQKPVTGSDVQKPVVQN